MAATRTDEDLQTLQRDGIVGHRGAFERDWVARLREDVEAAFAEVLARPGGAVGRGPRALLQRARSCPGRSWRSGWTRPAPATPRTTTWPSSAGSSTACLRSWPGT
jgi:hypothetical protein